MGLTIRGPVVAAQTAAPPDFIGGGAQKCGTSWWYSLVAQHPMVHDPAGFNKEARFFCQPGPFDLAAYHALFARPSGRIAGEWTPDYLWQPSSIDGVAAAAPHAKILFLVRDPVDRFVSGLAHLLMYDEPIHRRALRKTYRAGLYGVQARRLLRRFPRAQVCVLQYERCVADPSGELARTYAFLGLDPSFTPDSPTRLVHETVVEKPILPPLFAARVAAGYRRDSHRFASLFPDVDLRLWPSIGH